MHTHKITGTQQPFEICWDQLGIPHVYAHTQVDAFRGMGYAAGYERLWQIHLSTLFAQGNVASVLGKKFLVQDVVHRAFNIPAEQVGVPDSEGDFIVDAYLDGLNSYVDNLQEVPHEFLHAGCEPRRYTRADVASRYRFTSWFQQRTWVEKIFLGRLVATHGIEWWQGNMKPLSSQDKTLVAELHEPLKRLNINAAKLLYPDVHINQSGSNNWAIQGHLSASGKAMLATDPHQPHSIPNTFFYIHLSAPGWDTFGATFPGVPYFMMGYNRDLAWGLTTGCVDNYDVYIEKVSAGQYQSAEGSKPVNKRTETLQVKGQQDVEIAIHSTEHGPLLEPLMAELGISESEDQDYQTSVRWELAHHATSAGALSQMPLAKTAEQFGNTLFENDVAPLVNNIICVDKDNDLRRFIVATIPKRVGFTGLVPLAGWRADCNFTTSKASELLVEHNPACGYSLTANDDTLGDNHPYPIHNFPAPGARADRIREMLTSQKDTFTTDDFKRMQLDLNDANARQVVSEIGEHLTSDDPDVILAKTLLQAWDCVADVHSIGACVYYLLLDQHWHIQFMSEILDDPVIRSIPSCAIALNRWKISDFLYPGSPWQVHSDKVTKAVCTAAKKTIRRLRKDLGDNPDEWQFGSLHQIQFWHSLRKHAPWQTMQAGPSPIGGASTSLRMAMHINSAHLESTPEGHTPLRVYHGPAYRLIVDFAHPERASFVIAGGNSGRSTSQHVTDHYNKWLNGDYFDVYLDREDVQIESVWHMV